MKPQVMGILNLTPDSFYQHETDVRNLSTRIKHMLAEGASIIDIGACSTRPNAQIISAKEEWERLSQLANIQLPTDNVLYSIDTFRPVIARRAVEQFNFSIVNDISGGSEEMYQTVAELGATYILTHNAPLPATMSTLMKSVVDFLQQRIVRLHELGVQNIVIDPGFGFNKTIEQNFYLLHHLDELQVLACPVLVGLSHKSMIYKTLHSKPEEALNGTTVLHTIALQGGASILRTHHVKEAIETIKLVEITRKY